MSSRTSSRSTLTMVASTMSPSLKYLIVLSTAARKSASVPTSLIATCCVGARCSGTMVVSVDIRWVAPVRIVVVGGRREVVRAKGRKYPPRCDDNADVNYVNHDGGAMIPHLRNHR